MKYLCIDTNIYIQCCLLEIEGDSITELSKLLKLLDNEKVKLLLPEVIELELFRRLEEKTLIIRKKISEYKEIIGKDKDLDEKVRKDMVIKLGECIKEREENKKEVIKKIKEIFSHKNTKKKGLELNQDILIEAYKRYLSGKKPSKLKEGYIQNDCLIIENLKSLLKSEKNYKLYFCSLNKIDFAENVETQDDKIKIHSDVSKGFSHIEYYINLFELLNKQFGAKYSKASIKKLKEKEKIASLVLARSTVGPVVTSNAERLNFATKAAASAFKPAEYVSIGYDEPASSVLASASIGGVCRACRRPYSVADRALDRGYCDNCDSVFGTPVRLYGQ